MFKKPAYYSADSPAFTLRYPPRGSLASGLRIVVSTKVTKKATERNLIKRRLRQIWRELGKGTPPYVYVKRAALKLKFSELRSEFDTAFKRLQ